MIKELKQQGYLGFFSLFEHYFINVKKINQCVGKKVFINLLGYSNKLIKS